jgi:hypothetical protein
VEEKVLVTQMLIRRTLVLGDLILYPGTVIDGVKVDDDHYKIFVRNGWWVVDGIHIMPNHPQDREGG